MVGLGPSYGDKPSQFKWFVGMLRLNRQRPRQVANKKSSALKVLNTVFAFYFS